MRCPFSCLCASCLFESLGCAFLFVCVAIYVSRFSCGKISEDHPHGAYEIIRSIVDKS